MTDNEGDVWRGNVMIRQRYVDPWGNLVIRRGDFMLRLSPSGRRYLLRRAFDAFTEVWVSARDTGRYRIE